MKSKFLHVFFFIILNSACFGQNLTKTKKIIFKYSKGFSSLNSAGEYDKEEILEFIPISNDIFKRKILSIRRKYVYNPKTQKNDILVVDSTSKIDKKNISFDSFQNLIIQLNSNKDNFDLKNLIPNLSQISKREVISMAKQIDKLYFFVDDDNGKIDEFGKERIKKIRNYVKLDSFILGFKPTIESSLVVVDAWNTLRITFIEQTDTIEYRFQFYSLLGQPITKIINNDYTKEENFINIDILNLIKNFLSRKSIIKEAISFERFKEAYISWYINEKIWDK